MRERRLPLGEGDLSGTTDKAGRPRPRLCFRKGCGRLYAPTAWDQRFCGVPNCLAELRRWERVTGRLAPPGSPRRSDEQEVDYGLRCCARPACETEFFARSPNHHVCASCRAVVQAEQARVRQRNRRQRLAQTAGARAAAPVEAASVAADDGRHASHDLWQSVTFCERPGCYEARRSSPCRATRYCGADCARAVRRVLDRERRWRPAAPRTTLDRAPP